MTTARRPGYPCQHIYRPKNGKCSSTIICQAECTKERNGIGRCFPKHVILCACMHRQRQCWVRGSIRPDPPRPAADRIIFSIQKLDPHNPQTKTFISAPAPPKPAPAPPKPAGNPPNPRVILIILKIVILIKNDYFLII